MSEDGTIVIDQPGQVFHMLQCYYALRIEVNTGLKYSRGSVLKLVQRTYGITAGTKKGAMEQLKTKLAEAGHPIAEKNA